MKIIFSGLLISSLLMAGCKKAGDDGSITTKCLESKIEVFRNNSCDTGANVSEYTFQGKMVFVFDPGTCGADMTSEVMDSDCNTLGFLGGLTGNTKINGKEFSTAIFVKTIWVRS